MANPIGYVTCCGAGAPSWSSAHPSDPARIRMTTIAMINGTDHFLTFGASTAITLSRRPNAGEDI